MKTGIVSVTFRQLAVDEIIKLVKQAGMDGIEWGSDIHCPPGDIKNAKRIAELMEENSLETISYGSYYKLGTGDDFDCFLNTAIALKAPNIRVWAGVKNSEDANEEYYNDCVNDAKSICDKASAFGISISFEYHGGSLTNTQASVNRLINEMGKNNIFTYWQPLANTNYTQNLINIKELSSKSKLKNIHIYHWGNEERLPLLSGEEIWRSYLKAAQKDANAVLLEFVKDDSPMQFLEDAEVLRRIISKLKEP